MIIGICDDENSYIKEIIELIRLYSFENNVDIFTKTFKSISELETQVSYLDILFLEIRFGKENLGIEWAKELRKCGNDLIIIFCSSLKDMVFQGYEAEAFRFIVKPVVKVEIFKTLDACINKLEKVSKRISVVSSFGNTLIKISNIIYIHSKQRVYHIHLKNKSFVTTYENLKAIYERINCPNQFKYPHKSYIVNLAEINHLDAYTIYMSNGKQIPVSRNIAIQFKKDLIAFIRGQD